MGDGIDTDLLAPGAYMSGSLDTLSSHCLEALRLILPAPSARVISFLQVPALVSDHRVNRRQRR